MALMSKRRIALLVPEYRTDVAPGGGVATVADFYADALTRVRPDWELVILSPRMWHRANESRRVLAVGSWLRGITSTEVRVGERTVTYVGSDWAEFEAFRYLPRARLDALISSADIVVVVAGSPALFNAVRRAGVPVIGQVASVVAEERHRLRSSGPWPRRIKASINGRLAGLLDSRGIRVPRLVLVENHFMAGWAKSRISGRIELVPPGVDLSVFKPSETATPFAFPYILSVGRLGDPRKDVGTLVRAFAHAVTERVLPHHLVLAGNQSPPDKFVALARELGVGDRVHVLVALSRDRLVQTYQAADVFAMSSSEEGLGLVQLEALACGVPVVSTQTAGAAYILDGSRAGALVAFGPNLARRLGDAIADMALSEDRGSAAVAARVKANEFSSEALGLRFIALVEQQMRCPPVVD